MPIRPVIIAFAKGVVIIGFELVELVEPGSKRAIATPLPLPPIVIARSNRLYMLHIVYV